jgi:hypothetical protein
VNHQPLGYEPKKSRRFNKLQDAGRALSHCKQRLGIDIGQLMDSCKDLFNPMNLAIVLCYRT